jgi:hypothetical protein
VPAERSGDTLEYGVHFLSGRASSHVIVKSTPFGNPADSESPVALRLRLATGVLFPGGRPSEMGSATRPSATHQEDMVRDPIGLACIEYQTGRPRD